VERGAYQRRIARLVNKDLSIKLYRYNARTSREDQQEEEEEEQEQQQQQQQRLWSKISGRWRRRLFCTWKPAEARWRKTRKNGPVANLLINTAQCANR
jgi:hypothetical protein